MSEWSLGSGLFQNTFQGSNLIGYGWVLTVLLIAITLVLITRNTTKWTSLSLPITLMYTVIFKTSTGWVNSALILAAGIVWIISDIYPSLPKFTQVNIKNLVRDDHRLGRIIGGGKSINTRKEIRTTKQLLKGMDSPKTRDEFDYRLRQLTSKKGKDMLPLSEYREGRADLTGEPNFKLSIPKGATKMGEKRSILQKITRNRLGKSKETIKGAKSSGFLGTTLKDMSYDKSKGSSFKPSERWGWGNKSDNVAKQLINTKKEFKPTEDAQNFYAKAFRNNPFAKIEEVRKEYKKRKGKL